MNLLSFFGLALQQFCSRWILLETECLSTPGSPTAMVLESRELLKQEGLSPLTQSILAVCAKLDGWGARTWSLRRVGVITAIVLLVVRKVLKKQRGIDWYALLHAIVSSAASLACVYLDLYASEKLTGTPEPLRSLQCKPRPMGQL